MAELAGAQYSCETLRIDPFLDLTNASLCSRAVPFSPCQMRARFDICRSSHVWARSVCLLIFIKNVKLSEVGHAWSLDFI